MEQKTYQINLNDFLLVKDEASVKFHVKNEDYFGTLATILSLIKQSNKHKKIAEITLTELEDDLIFLQKNYKIIKRIKK